MWTLIAAVLFIFWCIGTFMESYHAAQGGRKVIQVKHECYGDKYCTICGKQLKKPRN